MTGVSGEIDGRVIEDVTLQPGDEWGRVLRTGEHLRIVDLDGKQAVDFLCFDQADPSDRYNAANTMKLTSNIFVGKGSGL